MWCSLFFFFFFQKSFLLSNFTGSIFPFHQEYLSINTWRKEVGVQRQPGPQRCLEVLRAGQLSSPVSQEMKHRTLGNQVPQPESDLSKGDNLITEEMEMCCFSMLVMSRGYPRPPCVQRFITTASPAFLDFALPLAFMPSPYLSVILPWHFGHGSHVRLQDISQEESRETFQVMG